jgi:hypothetical protein
MAEWGNPTAERRLSHTESIGMRSKTQGTEPSKYLEEKKPREIPQVAASERGRAQTHVGAKVHAVADGGLQESLRAACSSSRSYKGPRGERHGKAGQSG